MNKSQYSEEIILMVAKTTLSVAKSVVGILSRFGIGEDFINDFEAKIVKAESNPGNTEVLVDLKELTKDKDHIRDECYEWGGDLRLRMELAFGINSREYEMFPSNSFNGSRYSELKMIGVMDELIKLAETYAEDLAVFGQTPEVIAEGRELHEELREKDAAQELLKGTKPSTTVERNAMFKELYDTVNRINKTGRKVFRNDPAKLELFKSRWPRKGAKNSNSGNGEMTDGELVKPRLN